MSGEPCHGILVYLNPIMLRGFDQRSCSGGGGTHGPDLTLNLVQVFIILVHQNGPICAGMGTFVKFYPILM